MKIVIKSFFFVYREEERNEKKKKKEMVAGRKYLADRRPGKNIRSQKNKYYSLQYLLSNIL